VEEQWTQAQRTNNPDLIAPLLADKFIGIGTDGKIGNREQDLADAKATKFSSVDIEDLHITVQSTSAGDRRSKTTRLGFDAIETAAGIPCICASVERGLARFFKRGQGKISHLI
jgi:hypothetical protein